MKIHDKVRIKSGPYFDSHDTEFEREGRIVSIDGDTISIDMFDFDDSDDGNVLPGVSISDVDVIA